MNKPRLKEKYQKEIAPMLKEKLKYKNTMEVPKITKIVLNMCLSESVKNAKVLNNAVDELTVITGQKAVITKAKKAISNFKIRAGMPIGCFVTLRKEKMWTFFDRLISISLPKVKDFRGLSPKAFDGRGNFNLGLKEQIIFPEINYDKVDNIRGMNITICTTAKTNEHAKELLKAFNFPFK